MAFVAIGRLSLMHSRSETQGSRIIASIQALDVRETSPGRSKEVD